MKIFVYSFFNLLKKPQRLVANVEPTFVKRRGHVLDVLTYFQLNFKDVSCKDVLCLLR